jgi:uncharacterized glyoxalase superfamily protein PhnB
MAVKPIPDGYHTVTSYLVIEGAAQLIDFLKQAFEAQETFRMATPDGAIMHAEVQDRRFDGDDRRGVGTVEAEAQRTLPLCQNDADAVYRRALQAGALSVMEPKDQFYGALSWSSRPRQKIMPFNAPALRRLPDRCEHAMAASTSKVGL